jgi:deoxyadenosine/deoxycytidine kinase
MSSGLDYIAIDGVIGAGKTSLAKMLAESFSSRLILEQFEKNPFLEDFYSDPKHFAFQTQIFFLLDRFKQQEKLRQFDLFQTTLVSDYIFEKDRIFATLNLSEKEMFLYDGIARLMERQIVVPDLVIYLKASTNHLMDNIKKRDRSYEKTIDRSYIESLNSLYDQFFSNYKKTYLLTINTDELDFVNSDNDYTYICEKINSYE